MDIDRLAEAITPEGAAGEAPEAPSRLPATARLSPISTVAAQDEGAASVAVGGSFSGEVNSEGDLDVITVALQAGRTYLISLRGTGASPLLDPNLLFADPNGVQLATDDDGGTGINSLINFTAPVAGNYQITAGALPDSGGVGGYTVDVREMGADSVPGDFTSTTGLPMGQTSFGFIETMGDVDVYRVTLTAGRLYTFEVAGGADYNTNYLAVPPGELDTNLTLYDSAGNPVATNDDINFSPVPGEGDISSAIGYSVATSGVYYLRVEAYESNAGGGTGGYALVTSEIDLAGLVPTDALDWGSQIGTTSATVYFAAAGETFDGVTSLGWTDYEIGQAMAAFQVWADVTDLIFTRTSNAASATFRLVTTTTADYLGYMNPPGETNAGVGVFAVNGTGWDRLGNDGGLEQGGFGWVTLVHEFGHGIGLAHPHDNGGTSDILAGVTGPFGSYGAYDLNQGVYTTMSYNTGWQTHPDAVDGNPPGSPNQWGWQGGPGAFDIAVVQAKYGADSGRGSGDTVYTLATANAAGTFWHTIWDVGGTDVIVHDGSVPALIDLTSATLDYSPTGAGVVSYVDGVFGGFTIAYGVIIENATGGSGADVLIGNSANNVLDGRGGADNMIGRGGDDVYIVGDAGDVVTEKSGEGTDEVRTGLAQYTAAAFVERLTGTSGSGQTLRGNMLDNVITGQGGPDLLWLEQGGNDTAIGQGGDDSFYFGATLNAADVVDGGSGNDQMALQGHYNLVLGAGNLGGIETLVLLSGGDTRFGDPGTNFYDYNLTALDANLPVGATLTVTGTALRVGEDIRFDASAEASASYVFYAGLGSDTLIGGGGSDAFFFGNGGRFSAADSINGGGGGDQLALRGEYGGQIVFTASTMTNIEVLVVLSASDTRFAAGGSQFSYSLKSHDGNVGNGQLLVVTASGLKAGETLTFDGSAEMDGRFQLGGGAGNDVLIGGKGADTLFGGGGADTLTGGLGNDLFLYRALGQTTSAVRDQITDFASGDKIDLSVIDAKDALAGNQAFAFIGSNAFQSGVSGQLRVIQTGAAAVVEADVNGDQVADFVLNVTISDLHPLTPADFIL